MSDTPITVSPNYFNAAVDLIEGNLQAGREKKIAYIDDKQSYTFENLSNLVDRAASSLKRIGLEPEQRVLLCMFDDITLPVAFLGAIKVGIVPILANTMLTRADYHYMLSDSRARIAIVSKDLMGSFKGFNEKIPTLETIIVADGEDNSFFSLMNNETGEATKAADTVADEPCFWLYSSGSTGAPKGTIHAHGSLRSTAELYAKNTLEITQDDIVFSAAKLFFAYGLGNALTFPLSVGATTILMADRPTPESVLERLKAHEPTLFFGVPTLYAGLLENQDFCSYKPKRLRLSVSAGESLPPAIGRRWSTQTGTDILDGIGSTEMLHIFLSNRPNEIKYGTTGRPVEGYEIKILADEEKEVEPGSIGELFVSGPSSALSYWNQRVKSRQAFRGEWTRTGDKYYLDANGYYVYCGRSDDMLKVGGIYVSPTEVENTLVSHEAVLEAAVVGRADQAGLIKPEAFITLKPGKNNEPGLDEAIKKYVRSHIAPYKYPRWINIVNDLPKTATGKIQRYKLRQITSKKEEV